MNREKFLKQGLTLTGGFFLTQYAGAKPFKRVYKTLTLFHTNDIHSRIDSFPENHHKYGGKGGLINLNGLYEKEKSKVDYSMLLDCGDIFQGTPYFNFYKGRVEYETMSSMGYDATTLGNHDFDNGIKGLMAMNKYCKFPIINSNYNLFDSPLEALVHAYKIFHRGGLRIGIFGLGIDLEGLVPKENYKGVQYRNPIIVANEKANYLKKVINCDVIICLSHLGYQYKSNKVSDMVLAKSSKYIDVILGGHTHTFMQEPKIFKNAQKKPIIVNQAGWAALRLGQVNLKLS
jgi:5'-nucleotidase